jgi:hypothetical protein
MEEASKELTAEVTTETKELMLVRVIARTRSLFQSLLTWFLKPQVVRMMK